MLLLAFSLVPSGGFTVLSLALTPGAVCDGPPVHPDPKGPETQNISLRSSDLKRHVGGVEIYKHFVRGPVHFVLTPVLAGCPVGRR